jgi:hypothetical protein
VGKGVLRLLYLMAAAATITHIVACLFYYIAYLDDLSVRTLQSLAKQINMTR